jgi:2'-5' RNA ligase
MRIFIAIDFNDVIKQSLIRHIQILQKEYPQLKWVKRQSLHLTIKFIGEINPQILPEIFSLLSDELAHIPEFHLTSSDPGFFPSVKKARVFYLGLIMADPLATCFNIIDKKLDRIGIEKESKPFRPHVTLARVKDNNTNPALFEHLNAYKIQKLTIPVTEIVTMKSESGKFGSRYTPVQRFPLHSK